MTKENLENELKTLPNSTGVYQYFNQEGKLLYVGKAKILKIVLDLILLLLQIYMQIQEIL